MGIWSLLFGDEGMQESLFTEMRVGNSVRIGASPGATNA